MAADMRDRGARIEEVHNFAEENKLNINHWFFTTDLTHLKRGGRVSPAAAAMGTLLNICPILKVDYEGRLVPHKKIRGKKQAIKEVVNLMEDRALNGTSYSGKCFISNSACYDDAERVAELIEERFPKLNGR